MSRHEAHQSRTMHFIATKKAAIQAALTEFAKMLKRRELPSLRGQISWHGDLDQLRATRNIEAD